MSDRPWPVSSYRPAESASPVGTEALRALDERLTTAVALARRRAARDGHRQVDTAHLLHSLLESDRDVWDFVGDDGPYQVGRLLGYLVQRSIGYGLRWQGTVEDSGAGPAVTGSPFDHARRPEGADPFVDRGAYADRSARGRRPGWSPVAAAAMEWALRRARARRARRVACLDLFAALVADEECRAVEVLRRTGVDAGALAARLARQEQQG